MATEDQREAGIHWSVAVQEAARLVSSAPTGERTPEEVGEQIVKIAAEIWAWRGQCFPNGAVAQPTRGDPGPTPPDEWPDDREGYAAGPANNPPAFVPPPQGPVGQANPVCLCGAEKPWNSQFQGWFCPNQKKSRDPAVQAQQKLEHPPTWP